MSYRQGRQSPINIWEIREGEDDRQVAMATTDHKAAELVRLANLGAEAETANAILRKMLDDFGTFDEELGIIDVRIELTDDEQRYVSALRAGGAT